MNSEISKTNGEVVELDDVVILADALQQTTTISMTDGRELVKQFENDVCEVLPVYRYRDEWYRWNGRHYQTIHKDLVLKLIIEWLSGCECSKVVGKNDDGTPIFETSPVPTIGKTPTDMSTVIRAYRTLPCEQNTPFWIKKENAIGGTVVRFSNGMLVLETGELLPHDINLFSTNSLPHSYAPDSTCPQWLKFLDTVLQGDEELYSLLQKWFGYNLIDKNIYQKALMLYGPPRAGKGTIITVLAEMLGVESVAAVTLSEFTGRFALQPLLGKKAALIDEGHFSDKKKAVERLKAVTGGSPQLVDRKGVTALPNVIINARFTACTNDLFCLADDSAAIVSRFLVIPFKESFLGKEDVTLYDKLKAEVAGITNWALEGLKKLQAEGFQQPAVSQPLIEQMIESASPITQFLDECCQVGDKHCVRRDDAYIAWKSWSKDQGMPICKQATFVNKLRTVLKKLPSSRPTIDGRRIRVYHGFMLNPDIQAKLDKHNAFME